MANAGKVKRIWNVFRSAACACAYRIYLSRHPAEPLRSIHASRAATSAACDVIIGPLLDFYDL
jgi:hypothetical protein